MKFVCLGELLLRLTAPRRELLLQSPSFDVYFGGAEANVAVSLACFGHETAVASALPANALGEACRAELKRRGVDTRHVLTAPGRMGLYFLTPGAGLRAGEVVYDRADSSFARLAADGFDWPTVLSGGDWLHLSGITPALGPRSAELALAALEAARSSGVRVSFDCNFRPSLWKASNGDAAGVLAQLAALADLLFADERALALMLAREAQALAAQDAFATLAAAALARFPNVSRIATLTRVERDADHHVVGGRSADRTGVVTAEPRELSSIVDRIGSGDAFAAGMLHGLATARTASDALAFAVAAACLKHSIPGDANLVSVGEVDALLANRGFGVRR